MSLSATAVSLFAFVIAIAATPMVQERTAQFRTATRLVPISVVVHDESGKPVEGLTADDFVVTEDGEEVRVALFSVESRAATDRARAERTTNVFSNELSGTAAETVTVLLFDRLNTQDIHQHQARQHIIKYLRQLQPHDRIGFYVLDATSIRVLHDFTQDVSSLLRALDRAAGVTSGALAGSEDALGKFEGTGLAEIDAQLAAFLSQAEASAQGFQKEVRVRQSSGALEAIAQHLAGVQGRKNLIWVSSGFPIFFSDGIMRNGLRSMSADIARATRALSHSDIVVYPVDARGLPGVFSSQPVEAQQRFSTLEQRMANIETAEIISEQTGGRAYHSTNDIGNAIARAVADSDLTYMLGYYPKKEQWDGRFRRIRVRVKRSDVEVRHRSGYFAHPPAASDPATERSRLLDAIHAPLDATAVTLTVSVEPAASPNQYGLAIRVHPGGVTLSRTDAGIEGRIHLSVAQALPDGRMSRSADLQVPIRIDGAQREAVMKEGVTLNAKIDLRDDAHQVRIVVQDLATGRIGSVSIATERLRSLSTR